MTYRDVYIGDVWTTVSGMVKLTVCEDCGVPVIDQDEHDDFHERIDRACRNASTLNRIR